VVFVRGVLAITDKMGFVRGAFAISDFHFSNFPVFVVRFDEEAEIAFSGRDTM
jgi:hypothetical protein